MNEDTGIRVTREEILEHRFDMSFLNKHIDDCYQDIRETIAKQSNGNPELFSKHYDELMPLIIELGTLHELLGGQRWGLQMLEDSNDE